nr:hypothetical protein [Rhodococcus sp. (in: high G+C Gram-positive bacteria)]
MSTQSIEQQQNRNPSPYGQRVVVRTAMAAATILLIVAAALAFAFSGGGSGVSLNASPATTVTLPADRVLPSPQTTPGSIRVETVGWNPNTSKIVAYAGCIIGAGVPVGVAWAVATNPAAWPFITGRAASLPASVASQVNKWVYYLRGTCGYAFSR